MLFHLEVFILKNQTNLHMNKILLKAKIIESKLTHGLRKEILWPHITDNNYKIDIDDKDDTFHIGVYMRHTIISIGTFIKEKNTYFDVKNQYRLRAMATDTKFQRQGAGKCLILKGIEVLKEKKIDLLWCSARLKAIPFYKEMKMKSLNEIYHIVNIGPHKTMYLYLNN